MPTKSQFRKYYWVCATYLTLLIGYIVFCHWGADNYRLITDEATRTVWRSVLYIVAIVLFPLTNLLRFVLLRLNQTMPGNKTADERYFTTVCITQSLLHSVAIFGLAMFMLGDDFNTLYIFSVLGCLAVYLHRPQAAELEAIEDALTQHDTHQ